MKINYIIYYFTAKVLRDVFRTGTPVSAILSPLVKNSNFCDNLEDGERKFKCLIQKDY